MSSDPSILQAVHLRTGSRSAPPTPIRASGQTVRGSGFPDALAPFDAFEDEWRRVFSETSMAVRYRYEQLAPAYRHGGMLALNNRHPSEDWDQIEDVVRRDWEQRNPSTWDQARDAIRYAWQSVRTRLRAGDSAA